MKTFILWMQKPHGKNAAPINHISKVVVSAETLENAIALAMATNRYTGITNKWYEVKPGEVWIASA